MSDLQFYCMCSNGINVISNLTKPNTIRTELASQIEKLIRTHVVVAQWSSKENEV